MTENTVDMLHLDLRHICVYTQIRTFHLQNQTYCYGAVGALVDIDCDASIGALGDGFRVATSQLDIVVLQELCRTSERQNMLERSAAGVHLHSLTPAMPQSAAAASQA